MSHYSIKDLEHLTGVKAHTIRMWEQRYGLINPNRTDTNIRLYCDEDLKFLLNVALLKDNGYKISKISEMSAVEMQQEVLKLTERVMKYPEQIHALTIAMVDMDEDRFEKIISTNVLKIGFEKTMINVIYPFLSKIGVLWQTGTINPAQEHFISNLIRQKLIVAIDSQYAPLAKGAQKFVLFLPEGELHELTLLFADFLIRSRQHKTYYLGQSLPMRDLESVYQYAKPQYIVSVITTTPGPSEIQHYVNNLAAKFHGSTILLSGYQVIGQDIEKPSNVQIFSRLDQLIDFVEAHDPALVEA